jgi:hypothetical protein
MKSHLELLMNVLLLGAEGRFRNILDDGLGFLDTDGGPVELIVDNLWNPRQG